MTKPSHYDRNHSGRASPDGITLPDEGGHAHAGRRTFLRQSLALAIAPLVFALPVAALAWSHAPAATGKGTTIDVRSKGARGDGHTDDTAAIQSAIDALPAKGGTVTVPAGNYMIDASQAINLRSGVRFSMAPDARLSAIPNNLKRYHVIKVWRANNVQIEGGRIVGDRDNHHGEGGEWGYGINIQASDTVTVTDTHISGCWGDGMWIGALGVRAEAVVSTNVTLLRVTCTNNRRQGLSIGPVRGVKVLDSVFSNSEGTKPGDGIDIEPQGQGMAQDILIRGCTMSGNRSNGLEIQRNVKNVQVQRCTIIDNGGNGILAIAMTGLVVGNNTISRNGLVGVALASTTSQVRISDNTLAGNSTRYLRRLGSALGASGSGNQAHALRVEPSTNNVLLENNTF